MDHLPYRLLPEVVSANEASGTRTRSLGLESRRSSPPVAASLHLSATSSSLPIFIMAGNEEASPSRAASDGSASPRREPSEQSVSPRPAPAEEQSVQAAGAEEEEGDDDGEAIEEPGSEATHTARQDSSSSAAEGSGGSQPAASSSQGTATALAEASSSSAATDTKGWQASESGGATTSWNAFVGSMLTPQLHCTSLVTTSQCLLLLECSNEHNDLDESAR